MPSLEVALTTDRILTFNCYVHSQSRYGHYRYKCRRSKVICFESLGGNRGTDRISLGGNVIYITSQANAVGKNVGPSCS